MNSTRIAQGVGVGYNQFDGQGYDPMAEGPGSLPDFSMRPTDRVALAGKAMFDRAKEFNPSKISQDQHYEFIRTPKYNFGTRTNANILGYNLRAEEQSRATQGALANAAIYTSTFAAGSGVWKGITGGLKMRGLMGGLTAGVGGTLTGLAMPMIIAQPAVSFLQSGVEANLMQRQKIANTINDIHSSKAALGLTGQTDIETRMLGRDIFKSYKERGGFFNADSKETIHKIAISNGMMSAVKRGSADSGTIKQYKKNFEELVKTTEEVVKMLGTTIEDGMSIMKTMKSMGYSSLAEVRGAISSAKGLGMSTGLGYENMMKMGSLGAQSVAGTSFTGATGSRVFQNMTAMAATAYKYNSDMAASVNRAGGLDTASGILGRATMNAIASGLGDKSIAAILDQNSTLKNGVGAIDPKKLAKMVNGEISPVEALTATGNLVAKLGTDKVLWNKYKADAVNSMERPEVLLDGAFGIWRKSKSFASDKAARWAFAQEVSGGDHNSSLVVNDFLAADPRMDRYKAGISSANMLASLNEMGSYRRIGSGMIEKAVFGYRDFKRSVGRASYNAGGAILGAGDIISDVSSSITMGMLNNFGANKLGYTTVGSYVKNFGLSDGGMSLTKEQMIDDTFGNGDRSVRITGAIASDFASHYAKSTKRTNVSHLQEKMAERIRSGELTSEEANAAFVKLSMARNSKEANRMTGTLGRMFGDENFRFGEGEWVDFTTQGQELEDAVNKKPKSRGEAVTLALTSAGGASYLQKQTQATQEELTKVMKEYVAANKGALSEKGAKFEREYDSKKSYAPGDASGQKAIADAITKAMDVGSINKTSKAEDISKLARMDESTYLSRVKNKKVSDEDAARDYGTYVKRLSGNLLGISSNPESMSLLRSRIQSGEVVVRGLEGKLGSITQGEASLRGIPQLNTRMEDIARLALTDSKKAMSESSRLVAEANRLIPGAGFNANDIYGYSISGIKDANKRVEALTRANANLKYSEKSGFKLNAAAKMFSNRNAKVSAEEEMKANNAAKGISPAVISLARSENPYGMFDGVEKSDALGTARALEDAMNSILPFDAEGRTFKESRQGQHLIDLQVKGSLFRKGGDSFETIFTKIGGHVKASNAARGGLALNQFYMSSMGGNPAGMDNFTSQASTALLGINGNATNNANIVSNFLNGHKDIYKNVYRGDNGRYTADANMFYEGQSIESAQAAAMKKINGTLITSDAKAAVYDNQIKAIDNALKEVLNGKGFGSAATVLSDGFDEDYKAARKGLKLDGKNISAENTEKLLRNLQKDIESRKDAQGFNEMNSGKGSPIAGAHPPQMNYWNNVWMR